MRPVLQVARNLLGCSVVHERDGELLIGRILETEAYGGHLDPAAHSYRGLTERCRTMFGPPGRAYVYFTYGNHFMLNVTAGPDELASAVLLRAVEPLRGHAVLRELRAARTSSQGRAADFATGRADSELCNGPGKLAAAFGIDRTLDGQVLTRRGGLWLTAGPRVRRACWTPRIGLGHNSAAPWLWRCIDAGSSGTTRIPASWPRTARPSPSLSELRAAATAEEG